MNRPVAYLLLTVAIVASAIAAWYGWQRQEAPLPPNVAPVAVPAPPPPPPATTVRHPIDEAPIAGAGATAADLVLDHSDLALRAALAAVMPGGALPAFFNQDRIVRNVVASVDALGRDNVSPNVLPVAPVEGRFAVTPGDTLAIAPANEARYATYVAVVQALDARQLATVYLRHYALFQQAYRELGYPNGYFNDRLVEVIDLMLATPDVAGPVALEQPKVLYTYADPALERLAAGQKTLLRMGPAQAAVVKARLRDFRAQIVKAP
jgi:hypothetical protein